MTTYKEDKGVLHIIYTKEIPAYLLKISDIYEGKMDNRIGLNFPFDIAIKYSENEFKKYKDKVKYVIVYKKGDKETKEHELMHAKYYNDSSYKKRIDDMWEKMNDKSKKRVVEMLRRMGYKVDNISIVIDEFQAYYHTEKSNFFGKI